MAPGSNAVMEGKIDRGLRDGDRTFDQEEQVVDRATLPGKTEGLGAAGCDRWRRRDEAYCGGDALEDRRRRRSR
ncbi:unnamed protein product [Linum trigynum]|uniref:Uncharacterized protein n=1 Tax=Linum trigynum TaxID=586398 RepID=A0AAV2CNX0_9ROSI